MEPKDMGWPPPPFRMDDIKLRSTLANLKQAELIEILVAIGKYYRDCDEAKETASNTIKRLLK